MKKSVYLTGYKSQNLGDDLFFISILNRYKDTLFLFEDISSGYYSNLFKDYKNVTILPYIQDGLFQRIFGKAIKTINRYWEGQYYSRYQKKNKINVDAYVKIGGSIFIEPAKDLATIKWRFIAEKKFFDKVPFFYIGSNFGPYNSTSFFSYSEYVIKNINSICFRDSYSFDLFKQYSHVKQAPDVLFGIKDIIPGSKKIHKSLGISLMDFSNRHTIGSFYHSYLESISSYILSQCEKYGVIRLFSFCEPEGDCRAINDLLNLLPEKFVRHIEIVCYNGDAKQFLSKFSEMEFLISTRFHAMVLGFVYGMKTVPIVYSNKITHVLDDIKSQVQAIRLEKLNASTLEEAISCSEVINVDNQILNSQKQFSDFDAFIDYR